MNDSGDHKNFLHSEYASDFESDAQSEVGSLSSSRVEDDFVSICTGSKRRFDDLDKTKSTKIDDKLRRIGAQAVLPNAYQRHQKMVSDYLMYYGGSRQDFKRDTSSDKRDIDVVRTHNRFMWSEEDVPRTWEERLAKRYWDRLFKEYCMADLSRYKENKLGLRWRSKREVASGKGQFICGALSCGEATSLRSWEVNFSYTENCSKRNVLVKLRLCPRCSDKLNYHKQHTEHVHQDSGTQPKNEEEEEEEADLVPRKNASNENKEKNEVDLTAWRSSEVSGSSNATVPSDDAFDDYFKDMFM